MKIRLGDKQWTWRECRYVKRNGERLAGDCRYKKREVLIDRNNARYHGELFELNTIIHEATHAIRPELDEDAVENGSTELAELLYRLGYRRITCCGSSRNYLGKYPPHCLSGKGCDVCWRKYRQGAK